MPVSGTAVTYGQVDSKGRIVPGKSMRDELGLRAGSTVAFIKIGDALMVVPQDKHLEDLLDAAIRVLEKAHIGVEDLLDGLPAARDEVVTEHYGDAFLEELERAVRGTVRDTD
ncbi:MAG TPA: AbrB/MazE/SpoVT family DNA-binding domain-containing protein [Chloroflexota bacterium]|nr:AbrB/MazE/SpoVT family DNA-binding domain-containing protein [Chloroflexota bacterium]